MAGRIADLADAIRRQADAGEPLLPVDMRAIVGELCAISTDIHTPCSQETAPRRSRSKAASVKRAAA